MNILITICARGGSKGIPQKNIKLLNKIPLINYTISLAKNISKHWKSKISLSTDDQKIIEVAKLSEINTKYLRPKNLSDDKSGKVETIAHLINHEEKSSLTNFDFILVLDVSSPLRNLDDIKKGFDIINSDDQMLTLFSVSQPNRNPYFNVVEEDKLTGYYSLAKPLEKSFLSRQDAPKVYDMNASFYWYRRSFFEKEYNSPITDFTGVYIMDHVCFDLDHDLDFKFMEYLLKNNKLDFNL